MKTYETLKHYLLKDTETGEYVLKSTTKCWDKYIDHPVMTRVSFGDGPTYKVIQKIELP